MSGKSDLILTEETRLKWLKYYLESRYTLEGRLVCDVTDDVITRFATQVRILDIVSLYHSKSY